MNPTEKNKFYLFIDELDKKIVPYYCYKTNVYGDELDAYFTPIVSLQTIFKYF